MRPVRRHHCPRIATSFRRLIRCSDQLGAWALYAEAPLQDVVSHPPWVAPLPERDDEGRPSVSACAARSSPLQKPMRAPRKAVKRAQRPQLDKWPWRNIRP